MSTPWVPTFPTSHILYILSHRKEMFKYELPLLSSPFYLWISLLKLCNSLCYSFHKDFETRVYWEEVL